MNHRTSIDLYKFQLLDQEDQINLLYTQGTFVGKQKNDNRISVLYQLDSFYVEITYKKYRYYIVSLRSFSTVELINPYLADINITDLVKCVS